MSREQERARPITLAILAMGGEGGGVLAEWIVDLAEHAGYFAQMTSVPGVAQRTGATNYYVELFPATGKPDAPQPVLGLTAVPGDVDIVLASELMEAGRAVQRGFVTPDRTTFILSTNRVYAMTEKLGPADGRADSAALLEACRTAARRLIDGDLARIAEAHGSVISAVLFGALAGSRALPMQRAEFEAAIQRSGIGVKASRAAFAAGFAVAEGHVPAVESGPGAATASPAAALAALRPGLHAYPEAARPLLSAGIARLIDYQDFAYAQEYLNRLAPLASLDAGGLLLAETARELALGMAYEDVIRVADLKVRGERFARVRAEVRATPGQIIEIEEFLHPGVQEVADTLPEKLGRWLLRSGWPRRLLERLTASGRIIRTSSLRGFLLLYALASLRGLRRRSLRYSEEQKFLQRWLSLVLETAVGNPALAKEIAALRGLVTGYGATLARGRGTYETLVGLLPRIALAADPAGLLSRLRLAALADDNGAALAGALADNALETSPTR